MVSRALSARSVTIAIALILIAAYSSFAKAKDRQRISFYKINKDGITQALRFTARKASQPGCHNFIRKARLHRVVSYRYKYCHIYTKKSCDPESIMSFYLKRQANNPSSELTQGFAWYPVGDHPQGERAKSWHCE